MYYNPLNIYNYLNEAAFYTMQAHDQTGKVNRKELF